MMLKEAVQASILDSGGPYTEPSDQEPAADEPDAASAPQPDPRTTSPVSSQGASRWACLLCPASRSSGLLRLACHELCFGSMRRMLGSCWLVLHSSYHAARTGFSCARVHQHCSGEGSLRLQLIRVLPCTGSSSNTLGWCSQSVQSQMGPAVACCPLQQSGQDAADVAAQALLAAASPSVPLTHSAWAGSPQTLKPVIFCAGSHSSTLEWS